MGNKNIEAGDLTLRLKGISFIFSHPEFGELAYFAFPQDSKKILRNAEVFKGEYHSREELERRIQRSIISFGLYLKPNLLYRRHLNLHVTSR